MTEVTVLSDDNFQLTVTSRYVNLYMREEVQYAGIPSDDSYSIHIKNKSEHGSDVVIFINERSIGAWTMTAGGTLTIDRPQGISSDWSH